MDDPIGPGILSLTVIGGFLAGQLLSSLVTGDDDDEIRGNNNARSGNDGTEIGNIAGKLYKMTEEGIKWSIEDDMLLLDMRQFIRDDRMDFMAEKTLINRWLDDEDREEYRKNIIRGEYMDNKQPGFIKCKLEWFLAHFERLFNKLKRIAAENDIMNVQSQDKMNTIIAYSTDKMDKPIQTKVKSIKMDKEPHNNMTSKMRKRRSVTKNEYTNEGYVEQREIDRNRTLQPQTLRRRTKRTITVDNQESGIKNRSKKSKGSSN